MQHILSRQAILQRFRALLGLHMDWVSLLSLQDPEKRSQASFRSEAGIGARSNFQAVAYTPPSKPESKANAIPGGIPRIQRPSAMPHSMRGICARVGARLFLGTN